MFGDDTDEESPENGISSENRKLFHKIKDPRNHNVHKVNN